MLWRAVRNCLVLLFVVGVYLQVYAVAPKTMSYQGFLQDDDGIPINGAVNLRFRPYTTISSGSHVWQEIHNGVQVENGVFNVILGEKTAFNLTFDKQYFLGVRVNTDSELSPRHQLTAVPYALVSRDVKNDDDTEFLRPWTLMGACTLAVFAGVWLGAWQLLAPFSRHPGGDVIGPSPQDLWIAAGWIPAAVLSSAVALFCSWKGIFAPWSFRWAAAVSCMPILLVVLMMFGLAAWETTMTVALWRSPGMKALLAGQQIERGAISDYITRHAVDPGSRRTVIS